MRLRATLFVLSLGCISAAQPAIDDLVRKRMEATKTPGASVAIVRNGKVEMSKGYGVADVEHGVSVKPETVFEIGSVTKQFTATLIMMLIEQGTFGLDDSVTKLMPDLPDGWGTSTVRHLLNHTSGIKSYTSVPAFGPLIPTEATHAQLIKMVATEKPDFAPGEKWLYNNTGYYLLGMLVERQTKKTYRQALKDMILQPLDMKNTDMYLTGEVVPNRARGYTPTSTGLRNAEYMDMGWPFSAGSLMSTALDLAKWEAAQGSAKLLNRESWAEMWKPTMLTSGEVVQYGFGWGFKKLPGSMTIEHGGAIPGFQAHISRYPDKKLAVIVLTNSIAAPAQRITHDIAAALDPSLQPPADVAIADPSPELTKRLRKVFEDSLAGEADPMEFEEAFRKMLFPDAIKSAQTQIATFGKLKSFVLVSANDADGFKRRGYVATLGETRLSLNYVIDRAGKIAGLSIKPL